MQWSMGMGGGGAVASALGRDGSPGKHGRQRKARGGWALPGGIRAGDGAADGGQGCVFGQIRRAHACTPAPLDYHMTAFALKKHFSALCRNQSKTCLCSSFTA